MAGFMGKISGEESSPISSISGFGGKTASEDPVTTTSVQTPLAADPGEIEIPPQDPQPVAKGPGFMSKVADVAKGVVEGPVAVASGISSFLTGVPIAMGTALQGLMSGKPIEGLAAAGEELEKFSEATSFKPESSFGQTVAEVAASPFALAHKLIGEDITALGGDETAVKAAQFVFDAAVMVVPGAFKAAKEGRPIKRSDAKKVKAEVKKQAAETGEPGLDSKVLDEALAKLREVPEAEAGKARVESNQHIVDGLLAEAEKRTGPRKAAYTRAANKVAAWAVDAKDADLSSISKKKGKTWKFVEDAVVGREAPVEVGRAEALGQGQPEIVEPGIGRGEGFDLGTAEVVEPGVGRAESFGEARPEVVEPRFEGTPVEPEIVVPEGVEYQGTNQLGEVTLHNYIDTETKRNFSTLENTPEAVAEARVKINKDVKPEFEPEVVSDILPEETGPTAEDLVTEKKLVEVDLANLENELRAEQETPTRTPQDLMQIHKQWKDQSVEKINTASGPEVKPQDLGVVDDNFKTWRSAEEAQAYKEANGVEGEVITDEVTGESFLEPTLREIEDYSWEQVNDESLVREFESEEMYEGGGDVGELSDTGTRSLIDIFNNERGSVDITPLKIHADKMRELQEVAKRTGQNLETLLDSIGMDPEMAAKVLESMKRLPQDIEEIRKADPIIEGILNPPADSVIYQKVKKTKKGVSLHPPITAQIFKDVFGAKKIPMSESAINRFLDAFETRPNTMARFGKGVKETFYDNWTKELAKAQIEKKAAVREVKAISNALSKQDRQDISIVAHARQKNGPEILAADGITEIPKLSPRQEAVLNSMRLRYDILWDRINYVRSHIGLSPLPKTQNYFPWIHQQNALKTNKIADGLVNSKLSRLNAHSKKFSGSMFPFGKSRKASNIPIELDIFDAFEEYIGPALKEIHLNPIAALAKEVAGAKIKVPGQKGSLSLDKSNPALAKLLTEWSDEILGIDPVSRAINAKYPRLMSGFGQMSQNLVAATLFGNVGTVLKQPLALRGVWSDTSTLDTIGGIGRMMFDKSMRGGKSQAARKSSLLEIRNSELVFSDMAENIAKNGLRGVRSIANNFAKAPLIYIDALTAEAGWNAGYGYAKRKLKLPEPEAVQYAEDLVSRTQGVGTRGAVAPIQTTGALKWFTMFGTFAINDFNYITKEVLGIRNPEIKWSDKSGWQQKVSNTGKWVKFEMQPKQINRVLKYVVGGALINQVFQMAGMNPPTPSPTTGFKDSIDEGDSVGVATVEALKELLEPLPVIGGSIKFESSLGGPVAELASDIPEALNLAVKSIDWDSMSKKQKRRTALFVGKTVGTVMGIPMTNQIAKSIRTQAQGGDWYEIILGIYIDEKKKGGGPPRLPALGGPPKRP